MLNPLQMYFARAFFGAAGLPPPSSPLSNRRGKAAAAFAGWGWLLSAWRERSI